MSVRNEFSIDTSCGGSDFRIIHELGHFTVAKLCGVLVHEFSMGMGPALFKKQWGETTYALRLFPIGGFVAVEGEDEDSDNERAINRCPVWQRIIFVAAGAFMNVLFGFLPSLSVVALLMAGFELNVLLLGDGAGLLQGLDLTGRTVGGHDDLLAGLVEGVEGVEELLLGGGLARDEVDIVDEQDVAGAVLVTELGHGLSGHGVDHLVGEVLALDVDDPHVGDLLLQLVGDGVEKVSLTQTAGAVDEQGVVGLSGTVGHGDTGGVSELVGGTHDEVLKGILKVEGRHGGADIGTADVSVGVPVDVSVGVTIKFDVDEDAFYRGTAMFVQMTLDYFAD